MSLTKKPQSYLLSVIVPVYNEQNTLEKVITQVEKYAKTVKKNNHQKLTNKDFEIIIVNDGSTDNTAKICKQFETKSNFQVYNFVKNRGKGFALRHGIKQSRGEVILIQDADLEYHPKYFPTVLEPIIQGQAQVVYGSRLSQLPLNLNNLKSIRMPIHFVANKFLSWLTNLLYHSHLTDMETGYKAFSSQVLKQISLKSTGFEIEVELTAKILNLGIDIYEVPITTNPRNYEEGKKITSTDGVKAIYYLFKYRFKSYQIAYLLIMLAAAILRFWNFSNRYGLGPDQARDALVGRVALSQLNPPLLGSFSSAGPFTFGPWWYYYSMITAFIFESNLGYWLLISFFSLISVGALIWTGSLIAGPTLAVILGLLAAISPESIFSSLAATQHSAVNISTTFLLLVILLYHRTKKPIHLFTSGFLLGLTINFHYQGLYLLPLILLLIIFYRLKLKPILMLLIGVFLPFIPLLIFDLGHNWWNLRHLYEYYSVGQYNIYVPNRWLIYAGQFWPGLWAAVAGGYSWIGAMFMTGAALSLLFNFFRGKLTKPLIVYAASLLIAIIGFRYFRGERFFGYVAFTYPFILIFTAWLLANLTRSHRKIGTLLTIIVLSGSYLRFVHLSEGHNLHHAVSEVTKQLISNYPDQDFTVFDLGFTAPGCSFPLSLFLDTANASSEIGTPIGICLQGSCPQNVSTLTVIPTSDSYCQIVAFPSIEPPTSPQWVQVSPQATHHDTVEWWKN